MFSHKLMESELAVAVNTEAHSQLVEIFRNDTSDLPDGERKLEPAHCVLTTQYLQVAERILNLTVYEDDVWIVTFPKCGTTWTQEMVWLIDHDLDYDTASKIDLTRRSVFMEIGWFFKAFPHDTIAAVENLPRPRHIKSHLPQALLPKQLWTVKPRIVYCARNPKDVAVSFMHHYRHLHGYNGPQETFLEALLAEQVLYCPQIKHVLDFWNIRHLDNILFIHYEDMKMQMTDVLKEVSNFFKKSYTDDQLKKLAEHLSFAVMKKNPSANNTLLLEELGKLTGKKIEFEFMRRGEAGCHKDELTPEYLERLRVYIDQQLQGTNFKYREVSSI
ncbi:sulfotransferase 1 family member D1-like [Wyeomyia smithii]|uniref:sulfotransferase 1 family member D1-like n=1 Tax=Wyeomyia smithii TaxID=174621 RepID=UPI002467EFC2|nr:sulfotransferase 1 family member D1-like [Wyeomyia smithii]